MDENNLKCRKLVSPASLFLNEKVKSWKDEQHLSSHISPSYIHASMDSFLFAVFLLQNELYLVKGVPYLFWIGLLVKGFDLS